MRASLGATEQQLIISVTVTVLAGFLGRCDDRLFCHMDSTPFYGFALHFILFIGTS
jgi:hypothetical protein